MNADRRILQAAVGASVGASDEEKKAARQAALALRDHPFAFNGYLLLASRGARPTESNIVAEAKKLATANDRHYAEQRQRRQSERAA